MDKEQKFLKINIDPIENAVDTIATLNVAACFNMNDLKIDCLALDKKFKEHTEAIQSGDLKQIEAALYSHAIILQDYFSRTLKIASVATQFNHIKLLGELALKAQNQCRVTLATLADIKHPKRTTFIKQQNNAINQQVNNSQQLENSQNFSSVKNELLKEQHYETLDSKRTSETIQPNPKLVPME